MREPDDCTRADIFLWRTRAEVKWRDTASLRVHWNRLLRAQLPGHDGWYVFADALAENGYVRLGRRLISITNRWRRLNRAMTAKWLATGSASVHQERLYTQLKDEDRKIKLTIDRILYGYEH